MQNPLALVFDRRVLYGSAEHFFHFMWGYLLPALDAIGQLEPVPGRHYYLRSCGPQMDPLLREAMQLFGYPVTLVPEAELADGGRELLTVARWDIGLLRPQLALESTAREPVAGRHLRTMRAELLQHDELVQTYRAADFSANLRRAVLRLRAEFLQRLPASAESPAALTACDNCHLVLMRSATPAFYTPGGGAEIAGYGVSRRALTGVDTTVAALRQRGVPLQTFEPGIWPLAAQIRAFSRCKGIVAIKGAEFAHLIWLPPQAQVLLIKPSSMQTPAVQQALAELLGLDYADIDGGPERFPALTPAMLEPYLKAALQSDPTGGAGHVNTVWPVP